MKDEMAGIVENLRCPEKVWSRSEVLSSPCPVPKEPGIYAWYFKRIPEIIPTKNCVAINDLTLLYVGISPKRPPQNGKQPSRQRLFHRIKNHFKGNASGSTLRLTLGCLLSNDLELTLRRHGKKERLHFGKDEQKLSDWMAENAFVAWFVCDEPWKVETDLFTKLSLPLNLDQNRHHPFHKELSGIRSLAKQTARNSPVV